MLGTAPAYLRTVLVQLLDVEIFDRLAVLDARRVAQDARLRVTIRSLPTIQVTQLLSRCSAGQASGPRGACEGDLLWPQHGQQGCRHHSAQRCRGDDTLHQPPSHGAKSRGRPALIIKG